MEIKNTKDYDDVASIVALVYGVGGVGKTTMATTFPKPILLDFENGAKYFKQRGIDVDVVKMNAWFTEDDKKQLAKEIESYDTIVLDPIGEAMEKLIKSPHITGSKYRQSDGSLTIGGWGKAKEDFRLLMKWMRDTGKNVVLVAHVNEKSDDESLVKRPLIATKIVDEIIAMVDIVGYLDIVNDEGVEKRILRVNPADKKFIAKDRTGALENIVKPEYEYIHKMIKSKQKGVKKEVKKAPAKKSKVTKVSEKEIKKSNPFNKKK